MKHLFYFFTIFAIWYEIIVLYDTEKLIKYVKEATDPEYPETHLGGKLLMLLYFLWALTGLFTNQWWVFLSLIILGFIPKGNFLWLKKLDALLSLIILFFLILNEYHLHFNPFL